LRTLETHRLGIFHSDDLGKLAIVIWSIAIFTNDHFCQWPFCPILIFAYGYFGQESFWPILICILSLRNLSFLPNVILPIVAAPIINRLMKQQI
jgi:hypothetical protein